MTEQPTVLSHTTIIEPILIEKQVANTIARTISNLSSLEIWRLKALYLKAMSGFISSTKHPESRRLNLKGENTGQKRVLRKIKE